MIAAPGLPQNTQYSALTEIHSTRALSTAEDEKWENNCDHFCFLELVVPCEILAQFPTLQTWDNLKKKVPSLSQSVALRGTKKGLKWITEYEKGNSRKLETESVKNMLNITVRCARRRGGLVQGSLLIGNVIKGEWFEGRKDFPVCLMSLLSFSALFSSTPCFCLRATLDEYKWSGTVMIHFGVKYPQMKGIMFQLYRDNACCTHCCERGLKQCDWCYILMQPYLHLIASTWSDVVSGWQRVLGSERKDETFGNAACQGLWYSWFYFLTFFFVFAALLCPFPLFFLLPFWYFLFPQTPSYHTDCIYKYLHVHRDKKHWNLWNLPWTQKLNVVTVCANACDSTIKTVWPLVD